MLADFEVVPITWILAFTGGSGWRGEANSTLYSIQIDPEPDVPVLVMFSPKATASSRKLLGADPSATGVMSLAVTNHLCFIALLCGTARVLSFHTGVMLLGDSAAVPWYVRTLSFAS